MRVWFQRNQQAMFAKYSRVYRPKLPKLSEKKHNTKNLKSPRISPRMAMCAIFLEDMALWAYECERKQQCARRILQFFTGHTDDVTVIGNNNVRVRFQRMCHCAVKTVSGIGVPLSVFAEILLAQTNRIPCSGRSPNASKQGSGIERLYLRAHFLKVHQRKL